MTWRCLLAVLAVAGPWASVDGRDFDTGGPLSVRFDNTLRYNLGVRTEAVNTAIGSSPVFTSGEYSVAQGGLSANRMDLLSELDLAYQDRFGVRLSAAAWYDQAYADGTVNGSPTLAAAGIPTSYVDGKLSDYALHRYRGPWGELLDAFAFARFEVLDVPVTIKAGRHAVSWGESLMLPGNIHGIAYSQTPLDLQKGFATPGIEAKELFRPLTSLSLQAQVTPTLSVAAQYFLEWQSFLYPEGGTFLGGGDFAFNGPDGVYRRIGNTPSFLGNGGVNEPRSVGEWGLAVRWGPTWLDGTVGLYYRHYTDKLAAVLLIDNPSGIGPLSPDLPSPFQYRQYYGEGIDLFGLSFAKQLFGVSVGAEASYRHNMPLLAQQLGSVVAPSPALAPLLFPHGAPQLIGNSYQARGDTLHAVLNMVGVLSDVPAFSSAAWAVELTYSRWLSVGENPDMFYGVGYGVCRQDPGLSAAGLAKSRSDGCATRNAVAVGLVFTPTWFRVFSGVDLLAPLAFSWTIQGNSPVLLGGNEDSGTYSVGIAADVRNRYRFDLRYVDFFGGVKVSGTTITSSNGLLALLKDRGSVIFTAKATF